MPELETVGSLSIGETIDRPLRSTLLSIRIYLESLDSWRLSVKLPRRFSPVDGNGEMQRRNLSLFLSLAFVLLFGLNFI